MGPGSAGAGPPDATARACCRGLAPAPLAYGEILLPKSRVAGHASVHSVSARAFCLQGLELDALLASQQVVQEGGVRTISQRGHLAYDLPALSAALRTRQELFCSQGLGSVQGYRACC